MIVTIILMIATHAHAADPTDLPSSNDLHDTLIGMIHHHGITHVLSTIATAIPIAVSLPNSHDSHAHVHSTDRSAAILSAIGVIAAFVATLTNLSLHACDDADVNNDLNDGNRDWSHPVAGSAAALRQRAASTPGEPSREPQAAHGRALSCSTVFKVFARRKSARAPRWRRSVLQGAAEPLLQRRNLCEAHQIA